LRHTTSVANYASEFQAVAALLQYNDAALRGLFYTGLKPEIKDAIVTMGKASTLNALIDQSVAYDQRHSLHRQENPTYASRATMPARTAPGDNISSNAPGPRRGPLSEKEKARRRAKGLCLFCGTAGHFANACPELPKPSVRITEENSDDEATVCPMTPRVATPAPSYVTKNIDAQ
jgi:hypothetical protein